MNNGRAGKALAGMNTRRGASPKGQRSGKSLGQRREKGSTPAAHQSAAPQGAVADKPHSLASPMHREASTPDKPQGWPSATSQRSAAGRTAHPASEPVIAAPQHVPVGQ
jgi:hypothetical protein